MKTDIILSGVGGQGILSIAAVIGQAAVDLGLSMKQAEVHGMSQRGGDVQSHLRLSDKPVASDLIPKGKADLIISLEPMESLRYLPFINPETGVIVSNVEPVKNINNYPELEGILEQVKKHKHVLLDVSDIAKRLGSGRMANIVMLGAASPFIDIPYEKFEEGIRRIFGRKGEDVVAMNIKALQAGRDAAQQ
ncbi:MAG: indolepyruvate oxidoreductase subunit beta [Bacteroidales bacterium]|jgi:indolepyruvate ferredoxin oxidoreductase beta subunit|nr:indolepyruvate oxidoreductase subunit beta [Bacteroidales bacterium]